MSGERSLKNVNTGILSEITKRISEYDIASLKSTSKQFKLQMDTSNITHKHVRKLVKTITEYWFVKKQRVHFMMTFTNENRQSKRYVISPTTGANATSLRLVHFSLQAIGAPKEQFTIPDGSSNNKKIIFQWLMRAFVNESIQNLSRKEISLKLSSSKVKYTFSPTGHLINYVLEVDPSDNQYELIPILNNNDLLMELLDIFNFVDDDELLQWVNAD